MNEKAEGRLISFFRFNKSPSLLRIAVHFLPPRFYFLMVFERRGIHRNRRSHIHRVALQSRRRRRRRRKKGAAS